MRRIIIYSISVFLFGLFGCSSTKNIPEGDRLYTGATLKWNEGKRSDFKELKTELNSRVLPRPNSEFLGMPVKLWIYNMANPKKEKGLNKLLKRAGEPPVLFSNVRTANTSKILESYLEDNGFFQAEVESEVKNSGSKKASVNYILTPDLRYVIKTVQFETDSSRFGKDIRMLSNRSLLKKGNYFSLDVIKGERDRIQDRMRQRGYYYFSSDYVLIKVDSTNNGQVDLYVTIKPDIPDNAKRIYRIKSVTVYTNYSLEDSSQLRQPGIQYKDLKIVDPEKLYRPSLFDQTIFVRPDSIYRVRSHNITIQRFVNLGTFKYVRGQFRNSRSDSAMLNAQFYLTPYPKRSLQLELTGTSKSNNFVGSEIQVTARNRNWLKAANQLDIKLGAGFETQVGGGKQQLSSTAGYSITAGASVTIPKFFFPPFEYNLRTPTAPKTRLGLTYELLTRRNLYNLNGFGFDLSYIWKPVRFVEHTLSPISISLVVPSGITPIFDSLLKLDPALQQSLQKQFILGTSYNINFNNQNARQRTHAYYLNGNIDVSGNLAGLIIPKRNDSTKNLFGTPFAQYVRLTAEGRHYWTLNRNNKTVLVNRVLMGYGIPYGNSITLPFVKQYFIGGSNSVRAFRARTLGPGTFRDTASVLFANQAGDIKLELNTELRAKLFSIVNGAVFLDAGNIWLKSDSTSTLRPGSQFRLRNVFKELAVGTGVGLRIDASILIVRFDLAFPLRKPWLPEGQRWVTDQIDFGSPAWRRENLILNIAIGYPF